MKAANRVVFNTGILYTRMVITIFITLYTTRIVLNALGVKDYGLFNVIGGLVSMLSFLNAAMTTSTQRYISVNLGTKDLSKIKKVFANSVVLHFAIGILLVLLFEIVGLYFLNNQMKIDPERLGAANYLFQFVVVSTFISIISVPYDAVINAHENMIFLAITAILETILKLLVGFYLFYTDADKLLVYGLLMMVVAIIIRLIKRVYSHRKYQECHVNYKSEFDKVLIKELTSFAGWNLFGVLCYIFRTQGIAVVLNLFFSTIVNAAYGVASQVNSQLASFSQTMMQSLAPQMMKSEGEGNREKLLKLSIIAGKFSFILFSFFALPAFIEIEWILKMWLKNVPEYTIIFCRSIIVLTLVNQLNMGIMTAVQSMGRIKVYQAVAGSIQLLTLPVGYVFLKFGYPPYSIVIVSIFLEVISTIFRVFYFRYLSGFPVSRYFREVFLSCFVPFLLTFISLYYMHSLILLNDMFRALIVILSSVAIYSVAIYLLGINKEEKFFITSAILQLKNKFSKK